MVCGVKLITPWNEHFAVLDKATNASLHGLLLEHSTDCRIHGVNKADNGTNDRWCDAAESLGKKCSLTCCFLRSLTLAQQSWRNR